MKRTILAAALAAAAATAPAYADNLFTEIDAIVDNLTQTLPDNVERLLAEGENNVGQTGSDGDDYIKGNGGSNTQNGLGGKDLMVGLGGGDIMYGGNNNDELFGGGGHDQIYGGNGADRMAGGAGNDYINGEGGAHDRVLFDASFTSCTITGNPGNRTISCPLEGTDHVLNVEKYVFAGVEYLDADL